MKRIDEFLASYRSQPTQYRKAEFSFPSGVDGIEAGYYTVGDKEVFCFLGVPTGEVPRGGFPAVLLVHGGDGYAFFEWVKHWTDRGYAAMSIDLSAHYGVDESTRLLENPKGGPKGYGSIEDYADETPWLFFCVASVSAAVDVLTADARVDHGSIVAQGISWGGFVSLTAAAKEKRLKAVSIVYSSAFIADSDWGMAQGLQRLNPSQLKAYNETVDPQGYLQEIEVPVLFSAGTDDGAFTVKNRFRTSGRIASQTLFSYRKSYPHGHIEGWSEEEPTEFFRRVLGGKALPLVAVEAGKPIVENVVLCDLQLVYTKEDPFKKDICVWEEADASAMEAAIAASKAYFLLGRTQEGLLFSSNVYFTETDEK